MKKGYLLVALVVIALGYFGYSYLSSPGDYDEFAQCLTDSGAKMYGAYWCGHCNAQKDEFGNSWELINYEECSLPNGQGQTESCTMAGIRVYPTWEFADSSRQEGKLPFDMLSSKTGCVLS